MAFSDDVFPPEECCEICGIRLDDEVVIQEFADGSLARLCPECAAGAALGPEDETVPALYLGDDQADEAALFPDAVETDPMEMTKELLSPVADLICLQTEMQAALERLAASLERFASGVILESVDKSLAVDSRIRNLESELERTRARLREAESLLVASPPAPTPPTAEIVAPSPPATPPKDVFPVVPAPAADIERPVKPEPAPFPLAAADETVGQEDQAEAQPASAPDEYWPTAQEPEEEEWPSDEHAPDEYWPAAEQAPVEEEAAAPEAAADDDVTTVSQQEEVAPAPEGIPAGHGEVFSLEEIRWAQRCFNESPFIGRIRDVRRSLGKPKANLSRIAGSEPRVLVTVIWDIVWYQYLVNLRKDAPADQRVALFREGMDLEELAPHFKEKNSSMDDDGRLDASELEIRLLSDPTVLITEMPDDEEALEDATEEIWDQRISPEFKWDS